MSPILVPSLLLMPGSQTENKDSQQYKPFYFLIVLIKIIWEATKASVLPLSLFGCMCCSILSFQRVPGFLLGWSTSPQVAWWSLQAFSVALEKDNRSQSTAQLSEPEETLITENMDITEDISKLFRL